MQASGYTPVKAIGYLRVSTDEQADSGLGLTAQRERLAAEAARRGWQLELVEDEGLSAKDLRRPAIQGALLKLASGEADVLIAAKLDRLSRSTLDFASLMDLSRRQDWSLVVLDADVDTTTPAGRLMVNVLATFAEFERDIISQRTKDALAVKRAEGVKLGRPSSISREVREWIGRRRAVDGCSLHQIARELNAEAVPTSQGGERWWPSSVRAVLQAA